MQRLAALVDQPRATALVVLFGAMATIVGAYVFQYGFGYRPCALCLEQRVPYYVGMPIALATAFVARAKMTRLAGAGLALLSLIFLASAGPGVYHAGIEWTFWPGPADCAATGNAGDSIDDFLSRLNRIHVVSCTEAAWRLFGISLAGFNALISAALALIAGFAAKRALARAPAA